MLLYGTDGNTLIVWNEQATGSASLTITLDDHNRPVSVYDPLTSAEPTKQTSPFELSLTGYDCRIIR